MQTKRHSGNVSFGSAGSAVTADAIVKRLDDIQQDVRTIKNKMPRPMLTVGGGQTSVGRSEEASFKNALRRYCSTDCCMIDGSENPQSHHLLRMMHSGAVKPDDFGLDSFHDPRNGLLLSKTNHGLFETGRFTLLARNNQANRFTVFAFHQDAFHLHGNLVELYADVSLSAVGQHNSDCFQQSLSQGWDSQRRDEFEQLVITSGDETDMPFADQCRQHRVADWLEGQIADIVVPSTCEECDIPATTYCVECLGTHFCDQCDQNTHQGAKTPHVRTTFKPPSPLGRRKKTRPTFPMLAPVSLASLGSSFHAGAWR